MPTIRVPLSWLREYVDARGSAEEIGRALHMSGTEVDRIERPGGCLLYTSPSPRD